MLNDNCVPGDFPIGAMVCARGIAAKTILSDLSNPNSNKAIISNILATSALYFSRNTPLTLHARPLSTKYIPQIQGFQTTYINIAKYLTDYHQAFEYEATGQARTTLFFETTSNHLVAYSSIKCSSLLVQETLERICVFPTIELIMLCVDDRYHRQGIGEAVLSYLIKEIYKIKNSVGCRLITLFSVKNAVNFYKIKFNFHPLSQGMQIFLTPAYRDCVPMYLALPRENVP